MGALVGIALIWFIIEMLIWYLAAQFVSGWYVFFWFIIAAVIGIMMIRKAAGTLNPMAQQMKAIQKGVIPNPANQPAEATITKSIALGFSGLLFLLPGLLTDLVALLLLLPVVQNKLTAAAKDYALKNQDKMMQIMAKQMGGQSPFGVWAAVHLVKMAHLAKQAVLVRQLMAKPNLSIQTSSASSQPMMTDAKV